MRKKFRGRNQKRHPPSELNTYVGVQFSQSRSNCLRSGVKIGRGHLMFRPYFTNGRSWTEENNTGNSRGKSVRQAKGFLQRPPLRRERSGCKLEPSPPLAAVIPFEISGPTWFTKLWVLQTFPVKWTSLALFMQNWLGQDHVDEGEGTVDKLCDSAQKKEGVLRIGLRGKKLAGTG